MPSTRLKYMDIKVTQTDHAMVLSIVLIRPVGRVVLFSTVMGARRASLARVIVQAGDVRCWRIMRCVWLVVTVCGPNTV